MSPLAIAFAALAVSSWVERQTRRSIRRFVKTARRYRTIQIQAGPHVITAADSLPERPRRSHHQDQQRPAWCALV
jgi:hypothetical protein